MIKLPPHGKWPRSLSTRRLVLLATVANLGVAALVIGQTGLSQSLVPTLSATAAETAPRPTGFGDIVEKVKPAVISVRVKMDAPKTTSFEGGEMFPPNSRIERFFREFGMPDMGRMPNNERTPNNERRSQSRPMTGQGSGFFITADGFAVTNHHVVDKAKTVEIMTDDGKTYEAKVVGTDPHTDLAVIKVDGRSDFPYVKLSDKTPRVGDWVVAVGNPFGLGGTVTAGIVSARGRDIGAGPYDDFIQIDASVNKGNSGGPTFDMDGNVIGVNTAIFSPSGGSVGIAFDIPSDTVKTIVAQLKDKGVVTRGWIGVHIQPVTADIGDSLGMKEPRGALVADPQADGPAAKAGILSGDVITAVNGNAVKDAHDLAKQIGAMAPGSSAKLTLWRKGEERTISLTLGELPMQREARAAAPASEPSSTDVPKLGLMLAPAAQAAGSATEGVVVTQVEPNGLASEHGVKAGDVILDVGGKKVATPVDVRNAIGDAHKNGKRTVLMRLKSDDATRFVAIPFART
jgi:serine protease Do